MPSRRSPRTEPPATVADLARDPRNARRHGPRNVSTIVDALKDVGAARSIVIDEAGTILAGNATCEAATKAGITKVQVVDADGQTLVAVRRSGLTVEQKARLALYDNRAAELADGWDADVLRDLAEEMDLSALFHDDELKAILDQPAPTLEADPVASDRDDASLPGDRFGVIVLCDDERHQQRVYNDLQAAGYRVRVVVV